MNSRPRLGVNDASLTIRLEPSLEAGVYFGRQRRRLFCDILDEVPACSEFPEFR